MNWFLIINDANCKKELDSFLKKHAESLIIKQESEKNITNFDKVLTGLNNIADTSARISINSANSINILKVNDILHCKSHRSYTQVYLSNGSELTVTKTLKQFEEELSDYPFIRIHQSHLVNLNYISKYNKSNGGYLILANGTELPVAIRKKEQLFKELEKL